MKEREAADGPEQRYGREQRTVAPSSLRESDFLDDEEENEACYEEE